MFQQNVRKNTKCSASKAYVPQQNDETARFFRLRWPAGSMILPKKTIALTSWASKQRLYL